MDGRANENAMDLEIKITKFKSDKSEVRKELYRKVIFFALLIFAFGISGAIAVYNVHEIHFLNNTIYLALMAISISFIIFSILLLTTIPIEDVDFDSVVLKIPLLRFPAFFIMVCITIVMATFPWYVAIGLLIPASMSLYGFWKSQPKENGTHSYSLTRTKSSLFSGNEGKNHIDDKSNISWVDSFTTNSFTWGVSLFVLFLNHGIWPIFFHAGLYSANPNTGMILYHPFDTLAYKELDRMWYADTSLFIYSYAAVLVLPILDCSSPLCWTSCHNLTEASPEPQVGPGHIRMRQ
jgi:hypothetical protein